jgi:hypothetical protein
MTEYIPLCTLPCALQGGASLGLPAHGGCITPSPRHLFQ